MNITVHNITGVKVNFHMPENDNVIILEITSKSHGCFSDGKGNRIPNEDTDQITLYGLPKETTDALIKLFGSTEGAET